MISAMYPASNQNGKKDLAELISWLNDESQHPGQKLRAQGAAAESINLLHSRGKANAAAVHKTRPVSQRDADLAVSAIAFLLQDFDWAERTL